MRRVTVPPTEFGQVPAGLEQESAGRQFFGAGSEFTHECWGCPDVPCMTVSVPFDKEPRSSLELPLDPDLTLCPVGAIRRPLPGAAPVVSSECVGCGACVRACPVGAITIDPGTGRASVEQPVSLIEEMTFASLRKSRNASLTWDHTRADIHVPAFAVRVSRWMTDELDDSSARRFARAALAAEGLDPRMTIIGDNGHWPEGTAIAGERLLLIEVTSGLDLLDPLRRLLAAYAHIKRKLTKASSTEHRDVAITVISGRVPNRRSDAYRLMQDIENYLKIRTYFLPLAGLAVMLTRPGELAAFLANDDLADVEPGIRLSQGLLQFGFGQHLADLIAPAK